jgi:DegV family protein with EDD domain
MPKKKKIAILTDSSAYIPEEAACGLNIHTIPLWLIWDNEHIRDGVDITPKQFYTRLKAAKNIPTSSQPTCGEFKAYFEKLAAENDAVVAVLVSSKMSGTIASALSAQEELPDLNIRVVDSFATAMALGFCVLAAARAAQQGQSIDEVAAAAEDMRERVHFLFAVDTLEYLHKGGRIGGAKALMGTVLSIKPLLHFQNGQIEPLMSVRTKKKAIATMLDVAEERLSGGKMVEAAVLDVDAPDEGDAVAEVVSQRFGIKPIRATVSPVVGTHAGIGSVGLIFYGDC